MTAANLRDRLGRAKAAITIPAAWTRLGLPDPPPDGRDSIVTSPFREDRTPSFSIYDKGRRFRDHGQAEHAGDVVDFVRLAINRPKPEAISTVLSWAGDTAPLRGHGAGLVFTPPTAPAAPPPSRPDPQKKPSPSLAGERPLTHEEARQIAASRQLPVTAAEFLGATGMLLGCRDGSGALTGWALADGPGWPEPRVSGVVLPPTAYIAEGRRLNRQPFPHGAKAHTWAGSKKDWPIGISSLSWLGYQWRMLLAVEGGPDLLAAHALLARLDVFDALPVAIMSRETRRLHPTAAELLKGRHVHIVPHNDPGERYRNGLSAAEAWADLFYTAGAARVTASTLESLARPDGEPVKDLCDAIERGGLIRNNALLHKLLPANAS